MNSEQSPRETEGGGKIFCVTKSSTDVAIMSSFINLRKRKGLHRRSFKCVRDEKKIMLPTKDDFNLNTANNEETSLQTND